MSKNPLNCLAFSNLGFSIANLCFDFFRCIGERCPHIWPYIIRTRTCLFPRKSPPILLVPFIFEERILWMLSMHLTTLFLRWFSNNLYVFPTIHRNVDVFRWNEKCAINLTLGSTWSLLDSLSSHDESSCNRNGKCNSSNFPWRISCSSPYSCERVVLGKGAKALIS